jgi:hypothetical protein
MRDSLDLMLLRRRSEPLIDTSTRARLAPPPPAARARARTGLAACQQERAELRVAREAAADAARRRRRRGGGHGQRGREPALPMLAGRRG